MKREKKIMEFVVMFILLIGIGITTYAFYTDNLIFLFPAILCAIGAVKLDMLERYPYIITKFNFRNNSSRVEYELVFAYSIKWLKFLYFYQLKIKGNHPDCYIFGEYKNYKKEIREQALNKYFKKC